MGRSPIAPSGCWSKPGQQFFRKCAKLSRARVRRFANGQSGSWPGRATRTRSINFTRSRQSTVPTLILPHGQSPRLIASILRCELLELQSDNGWTRQFYSNLGTKPLPPWTPSGRHASACDGIRPRTLSATGLREQRFGIACRQGSTSIQRECMWNDSRRRFPLDSPGYYRTQCRNAISGDRGFQPSGSDRYVHA
jgi:hypothetical protein